VPPLPAQEVFPKSLLRSEPAQKPAAGSKQALAQHLLREAEQLRRMAAAGDDAVIGDELMDLAGRCAAAAGALLSHAGGHADKLTSQVLDR
jgi:hypothetical protein